MEMLYELVEHEPGWRISGRGSSFRVSEIVSSVTRETWKRVWRGGSPNPPNGEGVNQESSSSSSIEDGSERWLLFPSNDGGRLAVVRANRVSLVGEFDSFSTPGDFWEAPFDAPFVFSRAAWSPQASLLALSATNNRIYVIDHHGNLRHTIRGTYGSALGFRWRALDLLTGQNVEKQVESDLELVIVSEGALLLRIPFRNVNNYHPIGDDEPTHKVTPLNIHVCFDDTTLEPTPCDAGMNVHFKATPGIPAPSRLSFEDLDSSYELITDVSFAEFGSRVAVAGWVRSAQGHDSRKRRITEDAPRKKSSGENESDAHETVGAESRFVVAVWSIDDSISFLYSFDEESLFDSRTRLAGSTPSRWFSRFWRTGEDVSLSPLASLLLHPNGSRLAAVSRDQREVRVFSLSERERASDSGSLCLSVEDTLGEAGSRAGGTIKQFFDAVEWWQTPAVDALVCLHSGGKLTVSSLIPRVKGHNLLGNPEMFNPRTSLSRAVRGRFYLLEDTASASFAIRKLITFFEMSPTQLFNQRLSNGDLSGAQEIASQFVNDVNADRLFLARWNALLRARGGGEVGDDFLPVVSEQVIDEQALESTLGHVEDQLLAIDACARAIARTPEETMSIFQFGIRVSQSGSFPEQENQLKDCVRRLESFETSNLSEGVPFASSFARFQSSGLTAVVLGKAREQDTDSVRFFLSRHREEIGSILAVLDAFPLFEERFVFPLFKEEMSPTQEWVDWVIRRSRAIELETGLSDAAFSFCRNALNVFPPNHTTLLAPLKEICNLLEDLCALVYDAGHSSLTLDAYERFDHLERLKLFLFDAQPTSIISLLRNRAWNFLTRNDGAGDEEHSGLPTLALFLIWCASSGDLDLCAPIVEGSRITLPLEVRMIRSPVRLIEIALHCVYSCPSPATHVVLAVATRIFESLPVREENQSEVLDSLHDRVDLLDTHLSVAEILAKYGVPIPLEFFQNLSASRERFVLEEIVRNASAATRSPPEVDVGEPFHQWTGTNAQWLSLLRDCTYVARTVFSISLVDVDRIFFRAVCELGRISLLEELKGPLSHLSELDAGRICLEAAREWIQASSGEDGLDVAKDLCIHASSFGVDVNEDLAILETCRLSAAVGCPTPARIIPQLSRERRVDLVRTAVEASGASPLVFEFASVLLSHLKASEVSALVLTVSAEINVERNVEAAKHYCEELMAGGVAIESTWKVCAEVGRRTESADLFRFAVVHCPLDNLPALLDEFTTSEAEFADPLLSRFGPAFFGKRRGTSLVNVRSDPETAFATATDETIPIILDFLRRSQASVDVPALLSLFFDRRYAGPFVSRADFSSLTESLSRFFFLCPVGTILRMIETNFLLFEIECIDIVAELVESVIGRLGQRPAKRVPISVFGVKLDFASHSPRETKTEIANAERVLTDLRRKLVTLRALWNSREFSGHVLASVRSALGDTEKIEELIVSLSTSLPFSSLVRLCQSTMSLDVDKAQGKLQQLVPSIIPVQSPVPLRDEEEETPEQKLATVLSSLTGVRPKQSAPEASKISDPARQGGRGSSRWLGSLRSVTRALSALQLKAGEQSGESDEVAPGHGHVRPRVDIDDGSDDDDAEKIETSGWGWDNSTDDAEVANAKAPAKAVVTSDGREELPEHGSWDWDDSPVVKPIEESVNRMQLEELPAHKEVTEPEEQITRADWEWDEDDEGW